MEMSLARSRKGIFFSMIAILLAGLLIASFVTYSKYKYSDQMGIISLRINTMNDFLYSIEDDLERALYISSYRSLISLNEYIIDVNKSGGTLLENVTHAFNQIIVNGTIGSNTEQETLMVDQTITDWIEKMESLSSEIGITSDIALLSLEIGQSSPWAVEVKGNFSISAEDVKGLASWQKSSFSVVEIEVAGFKDPLYSNMTYGKLKTIEKTSIDEWNISNLITFLEEGSYAEKSSSPSFLMRMEGNLGGSPNGIISLIEEDDIIHSNTSSVDFVHWGMLDNRSQKIQNISNGCCPEFRLDPEHIEFFNVTGFNYTGP